VSPKKILEKKMFSPKSMSNLGRLTVPTDLQHHKSVSLAEYPKASLELLFIII
jgi:hypothetical protein